MTDQRPPGAHTPLYTRQPVLVVCQPLPSTASTPTDHFWIEVYGPRTVEASIVCPPCVGSVEGELAAEQFVEQSVGRRHRDIYCPGLCRTTQLVRPVSLAEAVDSAADQFLFRALGSLSEPHDAKGKVWI
jgi:hypothetical protein